jgi:hypothetical protein
MTRPVLILTLPAPPTVNNLFINVGRRRAKSKRYRAWLDRGEGNDASVLVTLRSAS